MLAALHGQVGWVFAHFLQELGVLDVVGHGIGQYIVVFWSEDYFRTATPVAGRSPSSHDLQILPVLLDLLPLPLPLLPLQILRVLAVVLKTGLFPDNQLPGFCLPGPPFLYLVEQLVPVVVSLLDLLDPQILLEVLVAGSVLVDALGNKGLLEGICLGEGTDVALLLLLLLTQQLVVVVFIVGLLALLSLLALLDQDVKLPSLHLHLLPLCLLQPHLFLEQGVQLLAVELLHGCLGGDRGRLLH